ncbi:type II CAAX prenyl endopeptidase Rce1 family protein [Naumannella halotolerans]|uniref:CAAX prenyl protease-like protein n=1 Tax=Naumannella halotolerans TaxID=993414 RepID=A0A4R7J8F2_9ACTN|nr:CPBP family glutamic-type intramembrane protease [Naumannella halotolerans]TDT33554.1 CAAX prenyl protease-like protein [Naumannella halotolerans]
MTRRPPLLLATLIFCLATALAAIPLWWWQPLTPEIAAAWPFASGAPLVGALAVLVTARQAGWSLPIDLAVPRTGQIGRRLVVGALVGFAVVISIIQVRIFFDWDPMPAQMSLLPLPLGVVSLITLVAVIAQEIGFRGVLQPILAERFDDRAAVVGVGVVWAAWALPGVAVIGPLQVLLLVVTQIALSALILRLGKGLRSGRTVVAIGFRWVLAMGLLVAGDEEAGVIAGMAIVAGVSVAIALVAPFVPNWARRAALGHSVV